MPGTVVATGRYGPRISAGASGLRSQVSRWLGPPHNRMKMHDFSAVGPLFGRSIRAASVPGTPRPRVLIPPSWSSCRRDNGDEALIKWLRRGHGGGIFILFPANSPGQ